jgi:hypothetical protein
MKHLFSRATALAGLVAVAGPGEALAHPGFHVHPHGFGLSAWVLFAVLALVVGGAVSRFAGEVWQRRDSG